MDDAERLAEFKRQVLRRQVNEQLELFSALANGHALWRAYALCRSAGEPLPEQILKHFDDIARRLVDAQTSQQVLSALHLGNERRGAPALTELHRERESREIRERLDQLRRLHPELKSENERLAVCAAERKKTVGALKKMLQRKSATPKTASSPVRDVFSLGDNL